MSWKGHTFTEDDLSQREVEAAKRKLGDDYGSWLEEKLAELTEKYRIVAHNDETGEDYIAEELTQRIINELPEAARSVVGNLVLLSVEHRRAVLAAFTRDGDLKSPFRKA